MTDLLLIAYIFLIAGIIAVPIATKLGLGLYGLPTGWYCHSLLTTLNG